MFDLQGLIAQRLQLDEKKVRMILEKLEGFGLVKKTGDRWIFTSGVIHLPNTSPMNSVQHGNWRSQAVLRSQDQYEDGLHYSIVQSISIEDTKKIRQLFLEVIDKYRKIANPSVPQELTCFTLDYFRV